MAQLEKAKASVLRAAAVATRVEEFTLARELLEVATSFQKKIDGKKRRARGG